MKKTGFLIFLLLGLFIGPVQADISSGSYWGIEYAKLSSEILIPDDSSAGGTTGTRKIKPEMDNLILRVGHYLANFLAVEIHIGSSLTEDFTASSSVKATNIASAFARFNMPLHQNNTNIYLMLGGTRTEIDVDENPFGTNLTGNTKATTVGASYIFGVELYSTPTSAVNIEYARYHLEDEVKYGGFTIGYINHFSFRNLLK